MMGPVEQEANGVHTGRRPLGRVRLGRAAALLAALCAITPFGIIVLAGTLTAGHESPVMEALVLLGGLSPLVGFLVGIVALVALHRTTEERYQVCAAFGMAVDALWVLVFVSVAVFGMVSDFGFT